MQKLTVLDYGLLHCEPCGPSLLPSKLTEIQAKYATLAAEHSNDALLVTDAEDRVLWLNAGFERMTGFSLQEMVGKTPREVLSSPDPNSKAFADIGIAIQQRRPAHSEVRYYRKDGSAFWMETTIIPIFDSEGRHVNFMSSSRDITDRKDLERVSEAAISRENERQKERKQLSETGEWLYSARSQEELLGVAKKSLQILIPEANGQLFLYSNSRNALDLKVSWGAVPDVPQIDAEDCWALRRGRAYPYGAQDIEFPCSHVTDQDDPSPYFCLPIIAHGQTIGLLHLYFEGRKNLARADAPEDHHPFFKRRWDVALICAEQISLAVANVRLRQELQDQSVRDPLTNLWNRRWLLEAAHKELDRYRTDEQPVSLISIDVDHFKKFNDHHGHDAGDLVLRAIGKHMSQAFDGNFSPCRIGGEEFIVLCANTPLEVAQEKAEAFRKSMTEMSVRYASALLPSITISAGVSSASDTHQGVVDLMKIADQALYHAKQMGRNKVCTAIDLENQQRPKIIATSRNANGSGSLTNGGTAKSPSTPSGMTR